MSKNHRVSPMIYKNKYTCNIEFFGITGSFLVAMLHDLIRNYFNERIYLTIALASSSDSAGCGDIGIAPQTPLPPFLILLAS